MSIDRLQDGAHRLPQGQRRKWPFHRQIAEISFARIRHDRRALSFIAPDLAFRAPGGKPVAGSGLVSGNLFRDPSRRPLRIISLRYGASNDKKISTAVEGLPWRHDPLLIARGGPGWSDSRNDQLEFGTAGGAQSGDFPRGADDPLQRTGLREPSQPQNLVA